jgi:hypothetical protein
MVNPTPATSSSRDSSVHPVPRTDNPLARAWISIALVPAFFLAAFAAAQGIYALTGHDPSAGATPPLWADLAAGLPSLVILLVPCIAGVVYGRRASRAGVRAGLVPAVIAALLGVGAVLLVLL